ncbi:ABC transporter permease [Microbacterium dextranolyticum]|uniref:Peptide ABC transporter permease n=1 Tax=Microbacterium dextranolyticum TaxID=36806 RepID=A0A9W6M6H0_9MICO|nr:ABC transporter permease [Microbacterium dextranolyticum]MBM7463720.1 putative ABC transport system permease protein [Microbacterium dextranolyticum]GLJ96449.1 peptide ABC transporter permease [Microbacterium dextranolyticum]
MSGLVGALSEAWAELRHHKLRVLLSLIGIAVSVAAIASVLALGDYIRQSQTEQSDRFGGRAATISVGAGRTDGAAMDWAVMDAAVQSATERFGLTHVTRRVDQLSAPAMIQTPDYVRPVTVRLADPDYAVIHRTALLAGRWFTADDTAALAPPVVITEALWNGIGAPPLAGHPTIEFTDALAGTYRIVGVTPAEWQGDTQKTVTLLPQTYLAHAEALPADQSMTWEMWMGPDRVDAIAPELAAQLRAAMGPDVHVSVSRSDWATRPDVRQSAQLFELVTGLIAGLVLLLGGLGLVNIQLVAMRQRIREIGVRRSFGATSARIFTTVLFENVVATAVAGIAGIVLAIIVLRVLFGMNVLPPLQDTPPFPLRAALVALAAAVGIGAVAGFLPALAAVRAKVIDALRI